MKAQALLSGGRVINRRLIFCLVDVRLIVCISAVRITVSVSTTFPVSVLTVILTDCPTDCPLPIFRDTPLTLRVKIIFSGRNGRPPVESTEPQSKARKLGGEYPVTPKPEHSSSTAPP